jgi:hypothetical protein
MLPLLLLAIALTGSLATKTSELLKTNSALATRDQALEKPYADAQKVRGQFDALVKGTALLAEQGNPHARKLLDALEKAGVNVRRSGAD